MESLTDEQRARLDALLAQLGTLPTSELIAEVGRLRCPLPLDSIGKKRMRLAIGGAIAAQKIISYLEALRAVDDLRGTIGREIYRLRQEARRLIAIESLEAAQPLVMAGHLSGRQEVTFHFFAMCVGRIERLLPIAAKASGYKVPKADRDLLATFRPLRDYYEHLEDRLPGGKNQTGVVTEDESEGQWRVQMGLSLDNQERIVIDGLAVDVSPRGVAAIEDVLQRNLEQLKASTLEMVRKHFETDPTDIPGPEDVKIDLLVSTVDRME